MQLRDVSVDCGICTVTVRMRFETSFFEWNMVRVVCSLVVLNDMNCLVLYHGR